VVGSFTRFHHLSFIQHVLDCLLIGPAAAALWEQKQLKPLSDQLTRVKDLTPPDFGSLEAWEKRAIAAGRLPNGDASTSDRPNHGQGSSGTPMPFLGETKVRVEGPLDVVSACQPYFFRRMSSFVRR
jgi:hypothetical protein